MTNRECILEFAQQTGSFTPDQLCAWVKGKKNTSRNSLICVLSRMVAKGEVSRCGKGIYKRTKGKTNFIPEAGNKEKQLYKILKEKFPFASFCIYNGNSFSAIQHHLSENRMTYVETDKAAMESVFYILRGNGENVWLHPDYELVYRYINLNEGGIIVKPLITESPISLIEGLPLPTLEKLLIDIQKDSDFSYMQGIEYMRMFEIANSLYNINLSRLRRYARRRGLTIKSNYD